MYVCKYATGKYARMELCQYASMHILAQAVDLPVVRRSGGRLATTLFSIPFFSIFSVATFSHRRSARVKKLIYLKLTGASKNVDTLPGPIGHFGAPYWPFLILRAERRCR